MDVLKPPLVYDEQQGMLLFAIEDARFKGPRTGNIVRFFAARILRAGYFLGAIDVLARQELEGPR